MRLLYIIEAVELDCQGFLSMCAWDVVGKHALCSSVRQCDVHVHGHIQSAGRPWSCLWDCAHVYKLKAKPNGYGHLRFNLCCHPILIFYLLVLSYLQRHLLLMYWTTNKLWKSMVTFDGVFFLPFLFCYLITYLGGWFKWSPEPIDNNNGMSPPILRHEF